MLHTKHVVLLFAAAAAAAISCAVSSDVHTFSFQAFDNTTLDEFIAVSNTAILTPASLLFNPDQAFTEFNRSEGFLLLARRVTVWRARDGSGGGVPDREASFNSTFTLAGTSPVSFVVLEDSITLNSPDGLRGPANASLFRAPDGRASDSLAAVEAGVARSYYRRDDDVPAGFGLNVTITPSGIAPSSRTVWVEYDARAHRLSVYVAAGGQPKPARAVLDAADLSLAGRRTTETAYVGFFGGTIRDVVVGVSGWELTVDALPGESDGNRNKETSWVMMLLAVLLSLAATAAI